MRCLKDDLRQCNASQREAICHGDGPALILAGPGSGKTTVITWRLRHLIGTRRIPPSDILVVTFTRAAAREMEQRFAALMQAAVPVRFGTFHAIYYHILRESSPKQSVSFLQEKEKQTYMRQVLRRQRLDTELAETFLDAVGRWKNQGCRAETVTAVDTAPAEAVRAVFAGYTRLCREAGKLDFDDMACECLRLLEERPAVLHTWQRRFRYVLVDEYQDIAPIQERILAMLARPESNLFVVGDDDQSVYGFRGAGPALMLSFAQRYPGTKEIVLETNYRCRPDIIRAADRVIRENKNRFVKTQRPARESAAQQAVICRGFTDREAQNAEICRILQERKRQGALRDTAVLFRRHSDATALTTLLRDAGIPCLHPVRKQTLAGHFVTEDITAYLRFVCGDATRKNFYRIMNRPFRGIARESCSGERVDLRAVAAYHCADAQVVSELHKLQKDRIRAAGLSLYAAFVYIKKGMGYEDWLRKTYRGAALEESLTVLRRLGTLAAKAGGGAEKTRAWERLLQEADDSDRDGGRAKDGGDSVTVLTCHGAKGLEFDEVFLPDLNEGCMPHQKAATEQEIEEERRLFYVGMTRAREKLYLFYRTGTEKEPENMSRFLKPLMDLPYCHKGF